MHNSSRPKFQSLSTLLNSDRPREADKVSIGQATLGVEICAKSARFMFWM
tara:strand:- start:773724 stop:773873 length:150 start_codon:yes stop_codon:yes gene_type:complete